jgi:cytochrome d ubiquinol oxidase subunit I
MVGLGFAMLGLGLFSLLARIRGGLYSWTLLHRLAVVMGPSGFIAVIAGWVTTEVGRQPYVVYHLLTTAQAASPIAAPAIGASLVAFIIVYFTVFGAGTIYILRLMSKAPGQDSHAESAPLRAAGIMPMPGLNAGEA